jgi:hypothetical protein
LIAVCTERPAALVPGIQGGSQDSGQPPGPRLRMRISGNLEGRLEPCGCASGQLGGLARRAFYLQQDSDFDLLLEGGNAVKDGSVLELKKLATALGILDLRGYSVLGLGGRDLELPLDDLTMYLQAYRLLPLAADLIEKAPPSDPGAAFPHKAYHDHDAGAPARIASLVMHLPAGAASERFTLLPPAQAWTKAMADCPPHRLRLLLVHGDAGEVRAAVKFTPRPDLVIGVSSAFNEPPRALETVDNVPVVFTGIRGRLIVDATLARRADGTSQLTRYEVIELAGSKTAPGAAEDRIARQMILEHRNEVKAEGLREQMAERWPTADGATYVGTSHCADCHEEADKVYRGSKHAQAWATLEKAEKGTRYGWPVTAHPDCVDCHVVGYGFKSGFVNPAQTPDLKDVGCEACHGPASRHVAYHAQTPGTAFTKEAAKMPKVEPGVCLRCHDFEQTPNFVYGERWKEIEHR